MTTYNNLEIAPVSLTFSGELDPSISTRTFNLSTLSFLPNVPLIDQIEVERIFDTGYDTKFGQNVFTISDRRQMFILPKAWYSVNEQTKILTVVDLSTIPTYTTNNLYYPASRTFVLETLDSNENLQTLDIPNFLVNNVGTNENNVVRQPDTVVIRRKTLSIDSIVTFAPGTRLTTTQLNLQFNQLKFIIQELVAKVRNEIILKFDENAVDGPFLGGSDLKMSNNYIKDLNSLSIGEINEQFSTGVGSGTISGATYATNVGAVYDALTKGTVCRTTMNGGSATPFSGNFTATPVGDTAKRITLMADAVDATDAATLGQVRNATNINTGTLTNAVLSNIPLSKLSNISGQDYTLPVDALANSGATAGSYGVSTAGNTNNMVYMTVDAKGRATAIASRNMAAEDLPTSGVTANTYGQSSANNSSNMLQLIVDNKGRITGATQRSLGNNDLPTSGVTAATYGAVSGTSTNTLTRFTVDNKGVITSADHRSIEVNDLPATSVTGAGSYGQAAANNTNNMLQVTYDTKGRVTSITHRNMGTNDLPSNIPLSKLNITNDGYTLPSNAIADASVTLAKINFGAGGTIPSSNLPTIDLGNINPANRGNFVLPTDSIPNIVTATSYNTQPVKDITIDAKGRVTSVSERGITDGDIPALSAGKITSGVFADALIPAPATAPTAGSYGSASNIPVITVDAKGRINTISTVTHAVANITDYTTATDTRIDNRALSRGTGSTYDAGSRKIINVLNPTAAQDVVTKNYLELNSLVVSGGVISAASTPITNMTMRAAGSVTANDAVNYGFIENLVLTPGTTLIGSTTPQIYRDAWSGLNKTSVNLAGFDLYQRTFSDLGAVASTMVLLEADAVTKTFVPYSVAATVGTVHDGYFWLDTSGGANKVLNVWLTTGSTPSGNLVTRNFGLSRLVSGALATTSSTGLVSILAGNDGGINVSAGELSLKQATSTQIGGIKQGTGLTITSGVAAVNLTDTINTSSSTIAASATAVKAAYDYAVGVQSNLTTTNNNFSTTNTNVTTAQTTANNALPKAGGTMTGLVTLATSTTSVTPLRFIGGSAPTNPADGAVWYESGTLKFQASAGTKTLAFTDSSLTGSAATANALTTARSIALGGDLSGSANFDGSAGITINATIQPDSVALGTDTTGNYVATVAAGTGITVTGSGSENAGVTITNSDTGSAQNIFKTVTAGGTSVTAASNNANLTLNAGTGISITGDNTTKTVTIANTTTPPNTFGTVVVAGTNLVADSSTDTLTINQGSGITLTSNDSTDTFTIANAGVTGLTGTTNQVNVSASTGSVTLSLPQAIHTAATPTFGSVTAKNLTLGSSNNTIVSTDTNGPINLDPNGTGIVNIQSPLDVDGTLNVDGVTTLVGNVTINSPSTLTLLNSEGKISLGAASSTTSINRQVATVAPATSGDLVLRVPTSGKAWLVANNEIATAPVAGNEIVTQAALTTALSPYATTASLGTYMAITGNLTTGSTNQVLGTGESATGSFIVKTANTARLTINAAGTTSIASGLGVSGNVTLANNLNVTGTTTLTGNVECSGNLTVNNIAWVNKVIQYPLIANIAAHTSSSYKEGQTTVGFTFSGTCPTAFLNKSLYYITPIKLTQVQSGIFGGSMTSIEIQDGSVTNCTASFYPVFQVLGTITPSITESAASYMPILNAGIIEDNGIAYSSALNMSLTSGTVTLFVLVKVIPTATSFSFISSYYAPTISSTRITTTPAQKIYGGFIKLA